MTEFGDVMLERIAIALENLNEKLIPVLAKMIGDEIKGEKSVKESDNLRDKKDKESITPEVATTDSMPLASIKENELNRSLYPKPSTTTTATAPPEDFQKLNENSITEAVTQDLKGVMIQFYTDKSILAVKNGYQKWVAFSLMANSTIKNDIEALKGTTVDIPLSDKAEKWFHKKLWVEYKEMEK